MLLRREKSSYYKRTYGHWSGLRHHLGHYLQRSTDWIPNLFIYPNEIQKNHKITILPVLSSTYLVSFPKDVGNQRYLFAQVLELIEVQFIIVVRIEKLESLERGHVDNIQGDWIMMVGGGRLMLLVTLLMSFMEVLLKASFTSPLDRNPSPFLSMDLKAACR